MKNKDAPARWFALAAFVAGSVVWIWCLLHDRVMLYGDGTAHLAIARRIVDSLTPGLSQWGTVWLPLPHLLAAPLTLIPSFWRTGAAGSLVSIAAFTLATWFLYRIVNSGFGQRAAGWAAALFLLNPSLLYLSAVPMTESVYLAFFLGLIDQVGRWATAEAADTPNLDIAWWAGLMGLAASLCRYDGWFLLPCAALALALTSSSTMRAWSAIWRFSFASVFGPAFWLAFNWFYFNDPLEFQRGPYSSRQIYLSALHQNGSPYPGDHNLALAVVYYLKAVTLTCGPVLSWLGLAGAAFWAWRRGRGPVALLLVPLLWYVWAMWSGDVPIFVPQYWPHGWYNLRYGVQLLPAAAAFAAAAIVWIDKRLNRPGVLAGLAALCLIAYALQLRGLGPPSYAEAVNNAPNRLHIEHDLAQALGSYRPGDRVLMYIGTFPGALAKNGIPIRNVIQESNFLYWQDAMSAPQRYVRWVVLEENTDLWKLVNRRYLRAYFHPVAAFTAPTEPHIEVFERNGGIQ